MSLKRETNRQANRDKQTYIHTYKQAYIQTGLPTYLHIYRQTDRQTDRQRDRETERQTGRQTDREIQQQHATGVSANKIRRCLSPCIFRCSGCTSISVSKHQGQEFNPTPLFDTTYACVWHGAYLAIRLTNLLPSRLVIQTAE